MSSSPPPNHENGLVGGGTTSHQSVFPSVIRLGQARDEEVKRKD